MHTQDLSTLDNNLGSTKGPEYDTKCIQNRNKQYLDAFEKNYFTASNIPQK